VEGKAVLERAIQIARHLPVLVLASRLHMSCYLDAMQLGAVDYLEKHVHPQDLVWVLETHLLSRNRASQ
jgi:DNA-binding NtrC family response regulator